MSLTRNRVSLGIRCRWGLRNGLFYVAKDSTTKQVLGVAMWMPPRALAKEATWDDWSQSWLLWFKQVGMNLYYGRGGLNVNRYWIWKDRQAMTQKELWTDSKGYYFCNIVTVLPSAQGRCYLESSRDQPNTAINERLGFKLAKEIECDDNGVVCRASLLPPSLAWTSMSSFFEAYISTLDQARS
jgi:hypothetical protein